MPAIEALKDFPTLQLIVGALVALVSIVLMLRADRDKRALPPPAPMPETQVYFQGPLVAALQALQNNTVVATKSQELLVEIRDELKWMNRLLSEGRALKRHPPTG